MRAVLDPNVLISSLVSAGGTPAVVLRHWERGTFELVVSDALLGELETALGYPKLRDRVSREDGIAFVALIRARTIVADDPHSPPRRSRDSRDDYLIALAENTESILVTGDGDLLALADEIPVMAPVEFLALLEPR